MAKITIALLLFVSIGCSCNKRQDISQSPPTTPPANTDTLPAQYGSAFTDVPDTKDIIMYEVNIRAFSQQHNLAGVINRLDSIKALGINVVWLMPIYPVGQLKSAGGLGSPYAVKDYTAVNPNFGTLDDLRTLVSEAHKKDMAVIFDWVADHTSWDNSWISNKSWYKQDASGNIISPPGMGWNDVAALNYDNNDMRKAMISAMKYWILTVNIDGYRCDYAEGVPLDFWNQAIDSLKAIPNHKLIFLAEGAKTNLFNAGFQMDYAWNYYTALKDVFENNKSATSLYTTDSAENADIPAGDYQLRFTSNHDEDLNDNTPIGLFNGKKGSMAAFVLAAYMGGVPLIYDGQEVGDSVKIPIFTQSTIDWNTNPDMEAAYKKIVAFRESDNAVKTGTITSYSNHDVVAFTKMNAQDTVLVLVNVRDNAVNYSFAPALENTAWKDALQDNNNVQLGKQINLSAYSYMVLEK